MAAYIFVQIDVTNSTIANLNDETALADATKGPEVLNALQDYLNGINGGLVSGPVTVQVCTSSASSTPTVSGTGALNHTYTF